MNSKGLKLGANGRDHLRRALSITGVRRKSKMPLLWVARRERGYFQ